MAVGSRLSGVLRADSQNPHHEPALAPLAHIGVLATILEQRPEASRNSVALQEKTMVSKLLVITTFCGLVLAVGCSSNGTQQGGPASADGQRALPAMLPPGGSVGQYIKNVVVIIQENRSFEDFFAGYPGANAPLSGCASPPPTGSVRFSQVRRVPRPQSTGSGSGCPSGDTLVKLHEVTFENNADLEHDWGSSMVDWNKGQMDGFSAYGTKQALYQAYAYMDHSQIAPYWDMAKDYVLADEMFPTEFGGSFTAHLTLVAGTDDIELPKEAEVNFPSHAPDDCDSPPGTKSSYLTPGRVVHFFQGPFPCFDQYNTIAPVLDKAGISWKIYATQLVDGGFWEPFEASRYVRYGPDWETNVIAPQTRFLTDAGDGNLASVDWVIPTQDNSDHPARRSDTGPSWVSSVVNAVGQSAYWQNSAIIILWDDWGGFYDNAPPPQLDYRGLGIRVPCLIISPYAKQGYVDHTQYEYGSILRFIEEVYGLPAGSIGPTSQGYTDARGASLDNAFDFTQSPRKFTSFKAKYPASYFMKEPPSHEPVDTE
jgi:phospholipase C